jgi:hypothetical protein
VNQEWFARCFVVRGKCIPGDDTVRASEIISAFLRLEELLD